MSYYYPTFAWFPTVPPIAVLADVMRVRLGGELPEFGVELPAEAGGSLECDAQRARSLLDQPDLHVDQFWLASELHSISFWLVRHSYVAIEFADFDSELYDDELTDDMRDAKRLLALRLHAALLEAGATLSYTESSDDISDTVEPSIDRAARIAEALAAGELETASRELRRSSPWLVGVRATGPLAAAIGDWLRTAFLPATEVVAEGRVYEHRYDRPLFLPPVKR
jgi:hypothetical protein